MTLFVGKERPKPQENRHHASHCTPLGWLTAAPVLKVQTLCAAPSHKGKNGCLQLCVVLFQSVWLSPALCSFPTRMVVSSFVLFSFSQCGCLQFCVLFPPAWLSPALCCPLSVSVVVSSFVLSSFSQLYVVLFQSAWLSPALCCPLPVSMVVYIFVLSSSNQHEGGERGRKKRAWCLSAPA